MTLTPRGWHPGLVETRFSDSAPQSYDRANRTVDCVISMGSPVRRFYGTETLRIAPKAVILDRMTSGGIPFLDSHSQNGIRSMLGRFTEIWFKPTALMGRIKFNETEEGEYAEGMVGRGELAGVSAGYRVEEWEITDADGRVIDPESRMNWDDDLRFEATRWELLEGSAVCVPADGSAGIRGLAGDDRYDRHVDVRARMLARQRMYDRQQRAGFGGDSND